MANIYDQMSPDSQRAVDAATMQAIKHLESIGFVVAEGDAFAHLREAVATYVSESTKE